MLLVGILSLLATSAPAVATTLKSVAFTGALTTNCGLGLPDQNANPVPQVKTGPKNEPLVNIPVQPNHCGFILRSDACVKASVGKKTGADPCVLVVTGPLWGNCLFFTGLGTLTLFNASGGKATLTYFVKLTGFDGLIHVTGGNKTNNVYGEVKIVLVTGDCETKTATGWAAAGALTVKTCTGGTTAGVCVP